MSSTQQYEKVYSLDIKGKLDNVYKRMAIGSLYGMIQGDCNFAVKTLNRQCETMGVRKPEQITVTQRDKVISRPWIYNGQQIDNGIWVGRMDMRIIDGDNEFWVYRDWFEENEIDRLHPEYENLWFHESDDCESHKRFVALCEQHGIERK